MLHTNPYNFMASDVVNQLDPIDSMKSFTQPNFIPCMY